MDFRYKLCVWCELRMQPLEACRSCPKYEKYALGHEPDLGMDAFCSRCANRNNAELSVFCNTNRRMQADSGEPFECYRFVLAGPEKP